MAKEGSKVLSLVAWLTGVIVSLAVGFAMTSGGPLSVIPYIPDVIVAIAGWVVIITTLISAVLAIIKN